MFTRLIRWFKSLFASAEPTPSFSGYIKDTVDARDQIFGTVDQRAILPPSVDLRDRCGPVDQQGNTNACVSHAMTTAVEVALGVADQSRLFVYWNARSFANQTGGDYGCTPRNAAKGLMSFGSAPETAWAYDTSKITVKPSPDAYIAAVPAKALIGSYQAVTTLTSLKTALSQGLPVAFGMIVPDTFVSVTKYTGVQPMWTTSSKWLGGHAMVAVGYDDSTGMVLVRNSFGTNWGQAGYCWIPYGWFANFTSKISDAWAFVPK